MTKIQYEFEYGKRVYFGFNIDIGRKKNLKRAAVLMAFANDVAGMDKKTKTTMVNAIINNAQFNYCEKVKGA